MRSSSLLACLLLACSGTRPRTVVTFDTPKPTTTPNLALVKYVVVDPLATLHAEPYDSSERARVLVSAEEAKAARSDDGKYALFRYVSEADGFVQIESIPTSESPKGYSCTESLEGLRPLRLSLHVRREGLAEVSKRRVRVPYGDGSAVTLASGVVLHPREDELLGHIVRIDGLPFAVALPTDAVDRVFVPGASFRAEASRGFLPGSFRFAGKTLSESDLDPESDLRSVYEMRKVGNEVVATLRSDCVQYEVVVGPKQVDEGAYGVGGLGMSGIGGGSASYVKAGAALYWRNGKRAGTAAERFVLPGGGPTGVRSCFTHLLAGDTATEETVSGVQSFFQLCVDKKDIE
jgi:hypothetical protein